MSSSVSIDSNKKVQQTSTQKRQIRGRRGAVWVRRSRKEHWDSRVFTSKGYYLKTAGHSTYVLTNMYEMKQRGQLCDVTLKVGSESFKAHRVVLASVSPYFFSMFNGEMQEQVSSEIVLRDIAVIGMKLLLVYAYTGEISITGDNVKVLLSTSTLLQMQKVKEACCKFLVEQLDPTNCLGIKSLADTVSCKELLEKSHCFIMENFQEVVSGKEFLLLPFNGVEELVSNSQLNISSEEVVYNAVLNWIKHDLINRSQYIAKLMVHVKLPLVSREFLLTTVKNELLVREDPQCREFLFEAMEYHLAVERRWTLATPRTVERKPKGAEPYLFAIGGGISKSKILSECEVYNPRLDNWSTIAPMLSKRRKFGVTGLHRLLYAVGGYDGNSRLATGECYNPLLNTWIPITPMGTPRCNLGVCSFDSSIYACGCYYEEFGLSSMERFDSLTGVWYSCPAMNTIRGYCRMAVVGFHGTNPLLSGERFDVRKIAWEPIPAGGGCRWGHEVVAIDGCIYAIGGYNNSLPLNSVERYNPKTNKWSVVSSMIATRCFPGAAVLDCIDIEHVLKRTNS